MLPANSRLYRGKFERIAGAANPMVRLLTTHGLAGETSSSHASFNVIRQKSRHRPKLQATVFQRQWPCTLTSLPRVSPIVIGAVGLPWHPHCGGFDLRSSSWYGPVAIVYGGVKGVSTRSAA
jgi:hypothetical protein